VRVVARFLRGEVGEAELFDEAGEGTEEKSEGRLCEAYFYAGELRMLKGEDGARALFEKCVGLQMINFSEHSMALGEIARIDARGSAAPAPQDFP
jgi:lipoprotein NlpI